MKLIGRARFESCHTSSLTRSPSQAGQTYRHVPAYVPEITSVGQPSSGRSVGLTQTLTSYVFIVNNFVDNDVRTPVINIVERSTLGQAIFSSIVPLLLDSGMMQLHKPYTLLFCCAAWLRHAAQQKKLRGWYDDGAAVIESARLPM